MTRTRERSRSVTQTRQYVKNAPALPPPAQTSEKGDKITKFTFLGGLTASALLVGLSLFSVAVQMKTFITASPINWIGVIGMLVLTAVTVLMTRALVWLSFFGSMMLASKVNGLKEQEILCRRALKWRKLAPALGPWASHVLVQNLISRGQFKDVIAIGEEEYAKSSSKKQDSQALGPLCTAVAISYQVQGDDREAIKWNERAVEALSDVIATLEKPGKDGKPAKANQWADGLRLQLAMAHFNAANACMKLMNYKAAKQHYQKATDVAYKAPDSAEKKQIITVAKEQIARLKHT